MQYVTLACIPLALPLPGQTASVIPVSSPHAFFFTTRENDVVQRNVYLIDQSDVRLIVNCHGRQRFPGSDFASLHFLARDVREFGTNPFKRSFLKINHYNSKCR